MTDEMESWSNNSTPALCCESGWPIGADAKGVAASLREAQDRQAVSDLKVLAIMAIVAVVGLLIEAVTFRHLGFLH